MSPTKNPGQDLPISDRGENNQAFARLLLNKHDSSESRNRKRLRDDSLCPRRKRRSTAAIAKGNQRYKCLICGKTVYRIRKRSRWATCACPMENAKMILRLLVEGSSIRSAERLTGVHRDTICSLLVLFGDACRRVLGQEDARPHA